MSFPGSGRGRNPDSGNNHVVMSAGRGAVLVAVAVIVGLGVLKAVDDSNSSASTTPVVTEAPTTPTGAVPATNANGSPATTTANGGGTSSTTKPKTTSTTAKSTKNARPNNEVVVQVLNGSGIQNAATTRTNDLKARGYQTAPAGNAPAPRTGSAVQCKAGYEKEAEQLVTELAAIGVTATIEQISNPLPTQFDGTANCYVLLGK
jgi:LytR cell envelope-related transcriptional attenuator